MMSASAGVPPAEAFVRNWPATWVIRKLIVMIRQAYPSEGTELTNAASGQG
jgi:hypothetical protein